MSSSAAADGGAALPGAASPTGTARYVAVRQLLPNAQVAFGDTGLSVGPVGFGCYRVHVSVPEHAEALRLALRGGCNLIDTSSNYGDGGSEELVGAVLAELIAAGELARDQVVVVSKVGYIQGRNLAIATAREAEGRPFPEVVRYAEGCWHCLHPDFLADQLDRSLQRLGLACLDFYLLHNPEYFLLDAQHRELLDAPAAVAQQQAHYYDRLQRAFAFLETQVAAGRIGAYGVSSNTFPTPLDEPTHTNLDRILAAAQAAGGDGHHFACIQFPFNLFEAGVAVEPSCSEGSQTVLERARDAGLATLANRPLNAATQQGMVRLTSFPTTPQAELDAGLAAAAPALRALQTELDAGLDATLRDAGVGPALPGLRQGLDLLLGLCESYAQFGDWMHWDHVRSQRLEPVVARGLHAVERQAGELAAWSRWSSRYRRQALALLGLVDAHYHNRAATRSQMLAAALDRLEPNLIVGANLQQKCLQLYRSAPGMHCILLGMRDPAYVADALAAAPRPPVRDPIGTLATFHAPGAV